MTPRQLQNEEMVGLSMNPINEQASARKQRSLKTRAKLLAAASDVFIEYGFQKTTISQIIKKAETGYGTAYLHFTGKDDILIQLMDEVMKQFYAIAQMTFTPRSKEEASAMIEKQAGLFLEMANQERDMMQVILAVPIVYEGYESTKPKAEKGDMPIIDITKYGEAAKSNFSLDDSYNIEYTMDLNTEMSNGEMAFTINGKTYPDTPPLQVKKGDRVKVKLVNKSPKDLHPMHLHGHFFQVLSKSRFGEPSR